MSFSNNESLLINPAYGALKAVKSLINSTNTNHKLLIETDSPYLSPVPLRGKKNEPSYIKHTLEKLANLKNIEVNKMNKITSCNFNLLFNL